MTDQGKTIAAAALLAAAVGVYMEISYQEKLKTEARRREYFPVPSASADSGARPDRHTRKPKPASNRELPPEPQESATPSR